MRIKTVAANYERKVNLGDYNSLTIGASAWADLDPEEDPNAAYRELFERLGKIVKEAAQELVVRQRARVQEVFAGLPVELRAGNGENRES